MRSSELGEPMAGRAGLARGWLAVEHDGPWARGAATEVLADALAGVGLDGIRVVLIRRRAAREPSDGPRAVFLAWSAGRSPWVRRFDIAGLGELADLVPLIREAPPTAGVAPELPVVLVCTHGKRDACCAEFGRPVHRALRDRADADVWECTHVGGDRFAANLVILPEGLHFSRLTPSTADAPIDAYLRGEIDLASFRGRSASSMAEQAAEHAVRAAGGVVGLHAAEVEGRSETPGGERVTVRAGDARFDVDVREAPLREDGVTHDCSRSDQAAMWRTWASVQVRPAEAAPTPS